MKVSTRPKQKEMATKRGSISSLKFNSVASVTSYITAQLNFDLQPSQLDRLTTVVETVFEFVMGDNMVLVDRIEMIERQF